MKREIWVNEYNWGMRKPTWIEQSRHLSKEAAKKQAKKCSANCGLKHRVRKLKPKQK